MSAYQAVSTRVRSLRPIGLRELMVSAVIGAVVYGVFGTVSALWHNPLFIRMTPTSGFETGLLAVQSALLGLYFGIRRSSCALPKAGVGGILGFLGVACPVCNKLLMLLFGSQLLLTYFEPVRLYVGIAGILLTGLALAQKLSMSASNSSYPTAQ